MPTHLSFDQCLYILYFHRGVNFVLVHAIRRNDGESHDGLGIRLEFVQTETRDKSDRFDVKRYSIRLSKHEQSLVNANPPYASATSRTFTGYIVMRG